MKRILALMCAAMLCACCLVLAACGGSGSSSAAASGSSASASASASSSAASSSAATTFVGDWKFAGMQMTTDAGTITMVGDLDAMASTFGGSSSSMTFGLSLKEDGTGTFVSGDSSYPITWAESAAGITITDASAASGSSASASASASSASASTGLGGIGSSVDLGYAEGVLALAMEQNGQAGVLFFTQDGKLPGSKEISAANAKPITNEADLVGTWKFTGMNMLGMSIFGDSEALISMMGNSGTDMNVTFEAGGKGTMSGSEFTYTVGADGATMDLGGTKLPVQNLDGSIMIDMSEQLGMPLIMVFSK